MRRMGLEAIYRAPKTSTPHPEHWVYPYLLRNVVATRPDQVRRADITYIPVRRGFLYLVAIMDWASRHVLAWRLSNTMNARFCVEALKRRSTDTASRTSSTPTKEASSPASTLPAC
jgi:putative transposase